MAVSLRGLCSKEEGACVKSLVKKKKKHKINNPLSHAKKKNINIHSCKTIELDWCLPTKWNAICKL